MTGVTRSRDLRGRVPRRPVPARELPGVYFRRASAPTVAAGVLTVAWAALVDGAAAAVGAGLGVLLVLAFFGIDLLVMRLSSHWDPIGTFGLVMAEYLGKIIALAVLFVALVNQTVPQQISTRWVGIGLAVAGVVFLAALVVAYLAVPTFVVEPESPDENRDIGT